MHIVTPSEASREFVQNTRTTKKKLRELHGAMVDLVALMNQPQRDQALLAEAGISLDRALFPLLVGIERYGPIGVVELSERAGRDYTTVSRQVAKLESLGLIERRPSPADRRVHEAVITDKGRQMTEALDAARQRIAAPTLARWSEEDFNDLVRLMRRFVDDLMAMSSGTDKT
ncbi:MarR family winged helix-turn-helix transcriptional regulator [Sorangium sp. So ce406]|uniref:MarR family winged helix-turn-helix transcriptional regulator n=1 Tax=Sorangium sp. So ce406 TaxID=3133311 RepID=UPI003F5C66D1